MKLSSEDSSRTRLCLTGDVITQDTFYNMLCDDCDAFSLQNEKPLYTLDLKLCRTVVEENSIGKPNCFRCVRLVNLRYVNDLGRGYRNTCTGIVTAQFNPFRESYDFLRNHTNNGQNMVFCDSAYTCQTEFITSTASARWRNSRG